MSKQQSLHDSGIMIELGPSVGATGESRFNSLNCIRIQNLMTDKWESIAKSRSRRTQKEEVGTKETHIVERLLKTGPSPSRVLSEGVPDIYYSEAIDQGLLLKLTFTKKFTDNYKT